MFNFIFRITPVRLAIAVLIVLFQAVDIHCNVAHAAGSGYEPSQMLSGGGGGGMAKIDKAGSEAKNALLGIAKILAILGFIVGLIMAIPAFGQKERGMTTMKWSGGIFLAAYLVDWLFTLAKQWVA